LIDHAQSSRLKVKLPYKLLALGCSVIALSWFFEGYRQVSQSPSIAHCAVLVLGVMTTAFLLWLQAFWIYVEEKSKGTLNKEILHFDRLQKYLERQTHSKNEGDCSDCD
jgi:dolichyl-phosphate-mannose--protein O-mannosyl transferase